MGIDVEYCNIGVFILGDPLSFVVNGYLYDGVDDALSYAEELSYRRLRE